MTKHAYPTGYDKYFNMLKKLFIYTEKLDGQSQFPSLSPSSTLIPQKYLRWIVFFKCHNHIILYIGKYFFSTVIIFPSSIFISIIPFMLGIKIRKSWKRILGFVLTVKCALSKSHQIIKTN